MKKNVVRIMEKSKSSKSWEVVDALEACLKEVKEGKINPSKILIHFYCNSPEEGGEGFFTAGVSVLEHLGLLEVAKIRALEAHHEK